MIRFTSRNGIKVAIVLSVICLTLVFVPFAHADAAHDAYINATLGISEGDIVIPFLLYRDSTPSLNAPSDPTFALSSAFATSANNHVETLTLDARTQGQASRDVVNSQASATGSVVIKGFSGNVIDITIDCEWALAAWVNDPFQESATATVFLDLFVMVDGSDQPINERVFEAALETPPNGTDSDVQTFTVTSLEPAEEIFILFTAGVEGSAQSDVPGL